MLLYRTSTLYPPPYFDQTRNSTIFIVVFSEQSMARFFLLFVIAVFPNSFLVSLGTVDHNLTTDQYVLLAFEAQLTADPHGILSNSWSANISTCRWIGVSCDAKQQRVVGLSLSNMGLNGTIAPLIGNLSFLISLDLSHNSFHGDIPQEIARLSRLREINLKSNYFAGNIPTWFGNISKLETLNLTQNFFHGNIPEEIGRLSNLKFLYLNDNLLTGSLPSAIFNMSMLQVIDLSINFLHDSLPIHICDHLPKLRTLYFWMNQFYGEIPSTLQNCPELEYVALSYNKFNGSIPKEISNLTMLRELYLNGNELKGSISLEIGHLVRLEVLDLSNCSLEGSLPSSIFNHSSLRMVSFTNNNFSGSLPQGNLFNLPMLEGLYLSSNELAGRIPFNLWKCGHLQELSLSYNKFEGSLPKEIGNLTMLKQLYLGGNNLTGAVPDEIGNLSLEKLSLHESSFSGLIPPKIFNISTLKVLDLNSNLFSGRLPSSMGIWLPNLQELYLSNNQFSGMIPSTLTNASMLIILDMSSNSFTGTIPTTLGNLGLLQVFLIGENNLTSNLELSFFSSLANCRNLRYLGIALNQLNGFLPISVGNLSTSLKVLQAFGSQIRGEIPDGIGNLSSLSSLSLDSNELTGFLPATLGRLKDLEVIYLEHNKLQGPIPDDLCMLSKLGNLYLSDNKLNGSIPACLGNVKSLRRLFLDLNKLTSLIPSTVWSNIDLLGVNLSSNLLTGYLPSEIGSLNVITEIDLSRNQILGQIPSSIGGAQLLTSLSFAHNRLQGPIPPSLGNLLSLEVLDLSCNNLVGNIPKSLEALSYLLFLNVSCNKLEGEIPSGGQFANFTAQSFMGNGALCGATRLDVPPCKSKLSKHVSPLAYILPVIASVIVVAALVYILKWPRNWRLNLAAEVDSLPLNQRRISYYELIGATESFSESNLIGSGSYGSVYKGVLSDGVAIAVKVFNLQLQGAMMSFNVECEILRKTRHRNLVKIISSCTNVNFISLILEYIPHGSLEKWLYSEEYFLDFIQRLNIMIDVGSAMEYLHDGQETTIVHCDLKPSNILLDEDTTAHVCDFGISKLIGEDKFMAETKTLGTIGYMAPEYGMDGRVSTRGDVYSYGIVLMEIFTRKKPTDDMFCGEMSLRSWVNKALQTSIYQVVDPNLIQREDENLLALEQCISSILGLAIDCTKHSPGARPSMSDVVVKLTKINLAFLTSTELKDPKNKGYGKKVSI